MARRRRHTPEQIVRKLPEADRLLDEGAAVVQYGCDPNGPNQPNQAWKPVRQPDGTYAVVAKVSGKALDAKFDFVLDDGAGPLVQRTDTGAVGQRWTFQLVGASSFGDHAPAGADEEPPPAPPGGRG